MRLWKKDLLKLWVGIASSWSGRQGSQNMRQLFTLTQKSRLSLDREWAGLGTLEASP